MGVYTSINDPSIYFQAATYNGNGGANTITNDGLSNLQPDFLWFKERSSTSSHHVFDTSRGVGGSGKALYPNSTDAESADTALTSVNTDGFTLANTGGFNENGQTNVCWQWKCNGGTTATNSDGSISVSLQVNQAAGFSIGTYTGTGSNGTIGHGLGVAPDVVLVKSRSETESWQMYHQGMGAFKAVELDGNGSVVTNSNRWQNTSPTSSVSYLGTGNSVNKSSQNYVVYSFVDKQGYSRFGKYVGNGNANGTFVYTGFKPAFLMIRRFDSGNHWMMHDEKRGNQGVRTNPQDDVLYANLNNAEADEDIDFLSNGFKCRVTGGGYNTSSGEYLFWAFAHNPFITSAGVPTTAR